MAITRLTALLRKGDENAIAQFGERIHAGEDPAKILKEAIAIANEAPPATRRVEENLFNLVGNDKLIFESGVFRLTGTINQAEAREIVKYAVNMLNDSESISNMARWVIGNIATILEEAGFSLGDFVEATEMNYNTVACSARTFREFRNKRYRLSFAHHKEIAYQAELTEEGKHAILQLCEEQGIPVLKARKIAKGVREKMKEGQIEDWAQAAQQALIEITDEPTTKSLYLLILPTGPQIIDRKPSDAEVGGSLGAYKLSKVIKDAGEETGEREEAEAGVPEPVRPDDDDVRVPIGATDVGF